MAPIKFQLVPTQDASSRTGQAGGDSVPRVKSAEERRKEAEDKIAFEMAAVKNTDLALPRCIKKAWKQHARKMIFTMTMVVLWSLSTILYGTGGLSFSLSPFGAIARDDEYSKYDADVLIVGAGLAGTMLAYLHATVRNETVMLIDKKSHVAGSSYDYVDDETGVRMNKYGAKSFHTDDERVWNLVTKMGGRWTPFERRVKARLEGRQDGMMDADYPINLKSMRKYFPPKKVQYSSNTLGELYDVHKNKHGSVPPKIYDLFSRGYISKQYGMERSELDIEDVKPYTTKEDRFFTAAHQAIPIAGFTNFVLGALEHPRITYYLNHDFGWFRQHVGLRRYKRVFYTGEVDEYFAESANKNDLPMLAYKYLQFEKLVRHLNGTRRFFQRELTLTEPSDSVPYIRTTEYSRYPWIPFRDGRASTKAISVLVRETVTDAPDQMHYKYALPSFEQKEVFLIYKDLMAAERSLYNVHFVGRLTNFDNNEHSQLGGVARTVVDSFEDIYQTRLPGVEQDLIFVTLTWLNKNSPDKKTARGYHLMDPETREMRDVVTGQYYTPQYEQRLMALCRLGYRIREDGNTYWLIFEDDDLLDAQVRDMVWKLGFTHFQYVALGEQTTNSGYNSVMDSTVHGYTGYVNAYEYITKMGLSKNATRIFRADDHVGMDMKVFDALRETPLPTGIDSKSRQRGDVLHDLGKYFIEPEENVELKEYLYTDNWTGGTMHVEEEGRQICHRILSEMKIEAPSNAGDAERAHDSIDGPQADYESRLSRESFYIKPPDRLKNETSTQYNKRVKEFNNKLREEHKKGKQKNLG